MNRLGKNIGHVGADCPPSPHAMVVLKRIVRNGPEPAQEMNFTVRDKLTQFGLITVEQRPSPYATHKSGRLVDFAVATEEGRKATEEGRKATEEGRKATEVRRG